MTLEDQILNIAEAPNWYDSRELRSIAFEVRKREDRIKQLEEALDTFTCVVELTPMKWNRALQEAFDMARAVLKAKEDKQ